ncbi:MAG TPA: MarR family transcriptional regulator [Magnetospirillaceae bacterium]|jgi:DNA-binding MarR family transcriptional regulator
MAAITSDRAGNAIAQWRRERPDLDPSPIGVLGRLAEAANRVQRDRLEPLFERFGINGGEYDVLASLRRSGGNYALTPTALCAATMVTSGGMTDRLDRLEKGGLIERRRNPADRRGRLIVLTKRGFARVEEVVVAHLENERGVLAGLTKAEQKQLAALLAKLIASLDAVENA